MKKTVLATLLVSTLALAAQTPADVAKLNADIDAAKAAKKKAEADIKALSAKLPQDQDIHTNVKFGYMKTDGNTNTEVISIDGKAKKNWGANSLSLLVDAQYGKAESIVNKKRVFSELEYGYGFTKTLMFTMVIGYKYDSFSSYDYQSYVGPGLKYLAYKSDKQELNLEASLLYSQDKIQEAFLPSSTLKEEYGSYKAKLTYSLKIIDNLKFNQELSYRASMDEADNYFAFSDSELSSKISDIFSTGISYKIDYTNLVGAGIEKQDNTLTAFISADF